MELCTKDVAMFLHFHAFLRAESGMGSLPAVALTSVKKPKEEPVVRITELNSIAGKKNTLSSWREWRSHYSRCAMLDLPGSHTADVGVCKAAEAVDDHVFFLRGCIRCETVGVRGIVSRREGVGGLSLFLRLLVGHSCVRDHRCSRLEFQSAELSSNCCETSSL